MSDISWLTAAPIAHRGYHDLNKAVWENTLPAFGRAIEHGYAIECDVHLTQDGEVVVFHDNDLVRLAGVDGFVWQRTLAEMASLRIGATADHPPSLADMLALVSGRVPLLIEIKGIAGHDAGLVAKVGEALRGYGGKVAVMSFDHWIIRDLPRHIPDRPRGLTAYGATARDMEAHFAMLAHGLSFVSYDIEALSNPFTRFVRERLAMPVLSWTIRDRAAMAKSSAFADQMTFEGFVPEGEAVA
jgi:glycerophosphoryl diester phosphodiesterase